MLRDPIEIGQMRSSSSFVRSSPGSGAGLVGANEEFMAWVRGEQSMPFGPEGEHVTIRLIDFDDIEHNTFVVANQVTFSLGIERRFDVVGFVNGLPLVVGEAKSPVRKAVTWIDGADQVCNDYEINVPSFFVPNVLSFATEGKEFRYGSIRMPVHLWAPWRLSDEATVGLQEVDRAVGVDAATGGRPGHRSKLHLVRY